MVKEFKDMTLDEQVNYWTGNFILGLGAGRPARSLIADIIMVTLKVGHEWQEQSEMENPQYISRRKVEEILDNMILKFAEKGSNVCVKRIRKDLGL